MNKRKQLFNALTATLLCCTLGNTACVNRIESEVQESNIPITFSTKIGKASTKVTNTAFNEGDNVGLFAVLSSESIEDRPYIDNLRLECGDKSTLIPEKAVFYPEGDFSLDFISYYPYQPEGKPEGAAAIPVSVETDQSDTLKHSLSDFLIAKKTKVESSSKPVELEYYHKMAKIKIILTPGADEDINEMLKANPRIAANGLYTKAEYNLQKDAFSNLTDVGDIVAFGQWKIEKGTLIGKEVIIIPQESGTPEQVFTMEWNGRVYSCMIPDLEMKSTTQYEINISAMQSSSNMLEGIVGKVCDWENGISGNTNNQKEYATIHLSTLSFKQSNVYRVYHKGQPIAEICREYLNSDQLTSRAIVAYPVLENEKPDLSQGVVLQLLDKSDAINGGKICWDTSVNSFTYQKGNAPAITQFYLNEKKEILLNRTDDAVNVNIASYTLRDIRNGQLDEYPIVKIGTQYWMGAELRATAYQNGKALSKQTSLGKGAGYFKPDRYNIYFYNGEALLAGKLNPIGWKMPSTEDWTKLTAYVKEDASLLKAGIWQILISGEAYPTTNLTRFNAYPVGIWYNGMHSYANSMTAFWSWDEANQKIPQKTVFFLGERNDFFASVTLVPEKDYYKALSIRCLKE